jgi:hypothetical protein
MKKTKNMKNEFISKVKQELDKASWTFQACNPSSRYDDVENKAIPFLDHQRWSVKIVEEKLKDSYSDILQLARELKVDNELIPKFFASYIADTLAHERIAPYAWSTYKPYVNNNKKWYINETVSFQII